jgi:hypothetical protein
MKVEPAKAKKAFTPKRIVITAETADEYQLLLTISAHGAFLVHQISERVKARGRQDDLAEGDLVYDQGKEFFDLFNKALHAASSSRYSNDDEEQE